MNIKSIVMQLAERCTSQKILDNGICYMAHISLNSPFRDHKS